MRLEREWHGDELQLRASRAAARATIGIGERISGQAKRNVHEISGDLRRSIHTAKVESGGELPATQQTVRAPEGATLEVGSWKEYACVEEVGRGHAFVQPAFEAVWPTAGITVHAAFRDEGL